MHLKLATLVVLPVLLVAAAPQSQPITRIPTQRRSFTKDGVVNIPALKQHLLKTQSKIDRGFANFKANTGNTHPADKAGLRKRATGTDQLTDDLDNELWQGNIEVGTPANTFSVDFDTGSSDLFLPGTACTDANCAGHKVYDTSKSSTAVDQNEPFTITFADGSSVQGEVFHDTVSIAGLTASDQAVVAASQYSSGFALDVSPPDGLMGMAFQQISNSNSPPVFETMIADGQATQSIFGFSLQTTGGELILGGIDTSAFTGSLTFAPLTTVGFWEINADGASVGGQQVVGGPQDSIVDTGTTLLIVDPDSASAIFAAVPGAADASRTVGEGFFTVPCNAIPDNIAITISGTDFTVPPSFLNLGEVSAGSNDCVAGIVGDNEGFWILGDVFLGGVFAAFDVGNTQVGFAPVA